MNMKGYVSSPPASCVAPLLSLSFPEDKEPNDEELEDEWSSDNEPSLPEYEELSELSESLSR
jgi:hypothetical protein